MSTAADTDQESNSALRKVRVTREEQEEEEEEEDEESAPEGQSLGFEVRRNGGETLTTLG